MDKLPSLISQSFKLEKFSISDESGFTTCVDITGIDLISDTRILLVEPSIAKAPLNIKFAPQKEVVSEKDSNIHKSVVFSDGVKPKMLGDDLSPAIVDTEHQSDIVPVQEIDLGQISLAFLDKNCTSIKMHIPQALDMDVVEDSESNAVSSSNLGVSEITKIDRPNLLWGLVSVQGRSDEMEDSAISLPGFLKIPSQMLTVNPNLGPTNQDSSAHVFGVYDGHGGYQVANYCKERLHFALAEEISNVEQNSSDGYSMMEWWTNVFIDCFHRVDDEVRVFPDNVGSTAVVAVVCSKQIVVANCGDSRAVLGRGKAVLPLSVDHKPDRDDECRRIEAAGGMVIDWFGFRVSGILAMSRSIGDRYLKPYLIADPEITIVPRTKEDECLILASDGLWDVMTNMEACDLARRRILHWHKRNGASIAKDGVTEMDPASQDAASYLSQVALQRGSRDNISVIVIDLKAHRKAKKKAV